MFADHTRLAPQTTELFAISAASAGQTIADPQTTFADHALTPSNRTCPETAASPQMISRDQSSRSPPNIVNIGTPVRSHQVFGAAEVSIALASAIAPDELISPVPWLSRSAPESGIALYSRIAFTAF